MQKQNSKAQQVRNIIAAAKQAGKQSDDEGVLKQVMEATGHPRQLSRAYIKGTWDKTADAGDTIADALADYVSGLPETAAPALEEMYEDAQEVAAEQVPAVEAVLPAPKRNRSKQPA